MSPSIPLFFSLCATLACGSPTERTQNEQRVPVEQTPQSTRSEARLSSDQGDRYLVPSEDTKRYYAGALDAKSFFTAKESQVEALEKALPAFLARSSDSGAQLLTKQMSSYRRQYVGVIHEGKELLFGNYFCADYGRAATDVVIVDDGGACFFAIYYDASSNAFSDLAINGEG